MSIEQITFEELLKTQVNGKDKDNEKIKITPDFRVAVQRSNNTGIHFIIHPCGYNGETLDFVVKGNKLFPLVSEVKEISLPKLNDTISTEQARKLCEFFKLNYLVNRIDAHSERFKSWVFDGCSGIPDELLGLFTGCDWEDITFKCCLPHDLAYAYGEPGNEIERERIDIKFYSDLVTKAGMEKWQAKIFLAIVRICGKEKFGSSFTWAFAQKRIVIV